jgi:glycosyltransferase involved in cell wall biosynthesis
MGMSVDVKQRPRVLWIGRMQFSNDVRVRETELARHIVEHADLFALDRTDAMPRTPQGFIGKVRMRAKLWNAATRVLEEGPVTRFRTRVAGATGPFFNRIAADFNNRKLERAVKHFGCTHVFLSSPFFFLPPPRGQRDYHVHFDLVDNFHDEWPTGLVGNSRRRFVREAMRNCDTLSGSSHSLCDHAERLTGRKAVYAPNGAPIERFERFTDADGKAIRERLGLGGKFVVGFIGNHLMDFDGMETLLGAFVKARESRPELALLIVGPGSDKLSGPRRLGREQGVWAIGAVPPDDVPAYFLACDAGVHPYDIRPLTHDATPLNVVEFSACGKPMLCNPLRELQRLALPNVRFARDGSVAAWAHALADPATFDRFDANALRHAVEPFNWAHSAEVVRKEMGL